MDEIKQKIRDLARRKEAIILAHCYQRPEVQEMADYVGDSFGLSYQATQCDNPLILFCGVHFMAETAAILNPEKKILMGDIKSGCPMANMITRERLVEKKAQHPNATVVGYVNTSAEVKTECDICCTSANALEVVDSIENTEILFVPDKSLGTYVASKRPNKRFIFWEGFCPTHHRILPKDIATLKEAHPEAEVMIHPECTMELIAMGDFVGGTGAMKQHAAQSTKQEFIVVSEDGTLHWLARENPGKVFYHVTKMATCPNMKKTRLEKMLDALETESSEVKVPEEIRRKALVPIQRMMAIQGIYAPTANQPTPPPFSPRVDVPAMSLEREERTLLPA